MIFEKNIRMVTVVEFKWYIAGIYILSIVICEFLYRQELCLIVLLPIDIYPKIHLQHAILRLNFAIRLRIKGV